MLTFTAEPTQTVNTTTSGDQFLSSITSLPGGGYAVVRTSSADEASGVFSQVYDAQGAKVGGETLLASSLTAGGVAALPDGSFVVAASASHSDGTGIIDEVYAMRVGADGQPQGGPFLVASGPGISSGSTMSAGDVYAAPDGGFYVGLLHFFKPTPLPGWSTELQRFDASGAAVGAAFTVTADGPNASVSVLPNGNIVAASDTVGGPAGPSVEWSLLTASGDVIAQRNIHESAQAVDDDPAVLALSSGNTVLAWHHEPAPFAPADASPAGTYIIITDGAGQPIEGPQLLDVPATPNLVALADGGFLAEWALPDGSGNTTDFAQEFSATAQALSDAFQIVPAHASTPTVTGFALPDIAATPDGGFVVTFDAAGTGKDVFVEKFDPAGQNLTGTDGPDHLQGASGPDTVAGGNGNDTLSGALGNDSLDGGGGIDMAVYSGNRSQYGLSQAGSANLVTGPEGTDTLVGVERLQFADAHVALDIFGNAGVTALLLGAVFGPDAVSDQQLAGIGLNLLDHGVSWENLMNLALTARLGAEHTNQQVVDLLYTNVVGAPPSDDVRAAFTGQLDSGAQTQASLGIFAAATPLNAANVDLVGLAQHGLDYQLVA